MKIIKWNHRFDLSCKCFQYFYCFIHESQMSSFFLRVLASSQTFVFSPFVLVLMLTFEWIRIQKSEEKVSKCTAQNMWDWARAWKTHFCVCMESSGVICLANNDHPHPESLLSSINASREWIASRYNEKCKIFYCKI